VRKYLVIGDHIDKGRREGSRLQMRALRNRLEHEASHDALTGLPNRTLFVERTEQALDCRTAGSMIAVFFIDLDDFKAVNDGLGHEVGDRVLASVATRLQECLSPTDLAARVGGDEFGLLIDGMSSQAAAESVAQRVIECLRTPFLIGGEEIVVRCSIGIAVSASAGDDVDELLGNADVAMYDAKEQGDRYEVFEPRMMEQVVKRHEYDAALRQALERHEFSVKYQPMVDLDSGEVVGVEALLRWDHPEQGVVSPADFIPLAEETGHIVPIGQWVLEEACGQVAQAQRMRPLGRPLVLSVNLSTRQLQHAGLVEEIVDLLDRTGFDPHNLLLEITESALIEDTDETIAILTALKELGVRVAIDDFGTGYSSLSYLRLLPVDVLKIAQPFIDALATDGEPEIFVDAIVHMGHTLNLEVVAEGVETPEQLAALRRMGCNMGQGFYFSRPLDGVATSLVHPERFGPLADLAEPSGPPPARLALVAG
jgi:diguanylate cyclase (GGDEF)-like protein